MEYGFNTWSWSSDRSRYIELIYHVQDVEGLIVRICFYALVAMEEKGDKMFHNAMLLHGCFNKMFNTENKEYVLCGSSSLFKDCLYELWCIIQHLLMCISLYIRSNDTAIVSLAVLHLRKISWWSFIQNTYSQPCISVNNSTVIYGTNFWTNYMKNTVFFGRIITLLSFWFLTLLIPPSSLDHCNGTIALILF